MNYESSVEYKQQMFSAVSSGSGLGWVGGGGARLIQTGFPTCVRAF